MPVLTAHEMSTLATALHNRAETAQQLAELTGLPLATVQAQLDAVERAGFVVVTNGIITYRRPETVASDASAAIADTLSDTLRTSMESVRALLTTIPPLLQAWENGENRLPIEVVHGPYASADIWRSQSSRGVPAVCDVMMPDTTLLFNALPVHQSAFWSERSGEPMRVRLLMSTTDATNPLAQERINAELAAGVDIRMHPNLPSWCWVTDHETVGIPLVWGQRWPSSVMAVRSPSIAALVSWIYERVWQESVPAGENRASHEWDALLSLMNRGMTMDAASLSLGLAPRTGRRRVAKAMEHFGATSQFSLGAAWAAHR